MVYQASPYHAPVATIHLLLMSFVLSVGISDGFLVPSVALARESTTNPSINLKFQLQQGQQGVKPLSLFPADSAVGGSALELASWWQNTDVWIFVAGLIPFTWATVEFWRRIAVGEPFGTGKDSVYIGKDNAPSESRGRRTLDRGAFLVAYILFGLAAASIGLTLYSVISSPPMDNVSL
jgi:hypothetical protein